MILTLINESALEYWLNGTDKVEYPHGKPVNLSKDFEFEMNDELADALAKQYKLTIPISFMVPERVPRQRHENYRLYLRSPRLPKESFVELTDRHGESVFVACPEWAFLYAARQFPLHEVVRIGCMLCARYVIDYNEPLGQRDRPPATTVNKIKRYLRKAGHIHGIKKARRALKYVLNNCKSPREVSLAVVACLARMYGGLSIYKAIMNGKIKLNEAGERLLRRSSIEVDMVWPKRRCALEYDSNLTHLDKTQHAKDKKRSTALSMLGYTLISVTADQLSGLSSVEKTLFMVRKALGMRARPKRFKKYEFLRDDLIRDMFFKPWKPEFPGFSTKKVRLQAKSS